MPRPLPSQIAVSLMTAAMCVACVAACSKSKEPAKEPPPKEAMKEPAKEPPKEPARDQVEVFSWWTGAGEQEGLDAMIADFKAKNPTIDVVNAAVAGGAGTNAKAILANRLQAGNPPDSYQRHAGLELADDIKAAKVEDLTKLYEAQGWKDKHDNVSDALRISEESRENLRRAGERSQRQLNLEEVAHRTDLHHRSDREVSIDVVVTTECQVEHRTIDRSGCESQAAPESPAVFVRASVRCTHDGACGQDSQQTGGTGPS